MKNKIRLLIAVVLLFGACFAVVPSVEAKAAVKLNKKNVTLVVGESTKLKLKGTKKRAKWKSSNKNVVTVSSKGKVKAKEKGNASITAKVGKKKYTCKITVKDKAIELQSISLNITSLHMKSGEQNSLSVTYTPINTTDDKTVQWSTSDSSIVSVDSNGNLSALREGNATIIATVGRKKASCVVSVKKTGAISDIYLSLEFNKSYKLSLKNANVKSWKSVKPNVASVTDDGTVTAIEPGNTDITCYDEYNNSYSCIVKVSYPDIKIRPLSTISKTTTEKYYFMKILVTNNTSTQVKFNNPVMVYFCEDNKSPMVLVNEDMDEPSTTNEFVVGSGENTYIYGYQGKSPLTVKSSGHVGVYIVYDGVEYIVYSDMTGKIINMIENNK